MFEFKNDFLMGPKSALLDGEYSVRLCSASSSAEDKLAELADLVGSGSTLRSAHEASQIDLVDSAPALEFDLENELAQAFETGADVTAPAKHEVFDTDALQQALVQPVEEVVTHPIAEPAASQALAEEFVQGDQLVPADTPIEEPLAAAFPVDQQFSGDEPSMDFSEMIADELDRALAEEVAADASLVQADTPLQTEVPAAPASIPTHDVDAELSKLLGETPAVRATPDSQAPAFQPVPPVPNVAQAPWQSPQIVDAPEVPSFAEPSAADAVHTDWQPPQMSDYESAPSTALDYSDPASEFQEFFAEEQPVAQPAPEAAPAFHAEAAYAGSDTFDSAEMPTTQNSESVFAQVEADVAAVLAGHPPITPQPDFVAVDPALDSATQHDGDLFAPVVPQMSAQAEKRNTGRKAAFAIVAVALLGGTAALGWNIVGGNSGPAPTLLASTEPVKVKPKDAGGKIVPNQDQAVYKSVEGNSENTLNQAKLKDDSEAPITVSTGIPKKSETRVAVNADAQTGGRIVQPRRVRTVVVKPDGTIVSSTKAAAPAAASGVTINEPTLALNPIIAEPSATSQPTTTSNSNGFSYSAPKAGDSLAPKPVKVASIKPTPVKVEPVKVTPVKVQPKPVAKAPTPIPKPVVKAVAKPKAKTTSAAVPSVSSPYAVQVSAQRSPEAAKKSYSTLLRRYASVLQGKGVDIRKGTVKGKGTYYRVRIPANSKSAASQLCSQLKAKGGSCFVTR